MLIDTKFLDDGLAIVSLSGRLVHASALHSLTQAVQGLSAIGRRGILFDLGKVQKLNMSGLAALIELVARHPKIEIGLCAVPDKALKMIHKSGLDRGLLIYPDVQTAQADPNFRSHALRGVKTVLLCAGKGSRVAPLTEVTPKPMLDIAGYPVLHLILNHLAQFGLRDVIMNPGHRGFEIVNYFQNTILPDHNIQFVNEGRGHAGSWQSNPIGSASTLKRLQDDHAAFATDLVVLCGDALIDLDLADMMRVHRQSDAEVTIAALTVAKDEVHKYGIIETGPTGFIERFVEKPGPGVTDSCLANSGIYIFKPQVLELISSAPGLDIACDLLPAVMATQGRMQVYNEPFSWIDIGCGRDYVRAVQKVLDGQVPGVRPAGEEIKPGVWVAPTGQVAPRARITGPCYVSAGAEVKAGATIEGPCCIGAGALVEKSSLLRNSIVMPQTHVRSGAWAENMILHGTWAVDHTRADGTPQNREPLAGVSQLQQLSTADQKKRA